MVEVHGLLNVDGAVAGRLAGRGVIWQLIDTRPPPVLRWLMMPVVLMLADVIMTTGRAVAHQYPGPASAPPGWFPSFPRSAPVTRPGRPSGKPSASRIPDGPWPCRTVTCWSPAWATSIRRRATSQLIDAVAACRRHARPRPISS